MSLLVSGSFTASCISSPPILFKFICTIGYAVRKYGWPKSVLPDLWSGLDSRAPLPYYLQQRGGFGIGHASLERPGLKHPYQRRSSNSKPPFPFFLLIRWGVRNSGVSRKGPIPVVSPFVSFSSPPDRVPRLIPFSSSLSSDICPSLVDVTKGCDQSLMHKVLSRFRDSCGRSSCHLHLPISETPKWSKPTNVTHGMKCVEYCHVSL
jgi:hypothetical protein